MYSESIGSSDLDRRCRRLSVSVQWLALAVLIAEAMFAISVIASIVDPASAAAASLLVTIAILAVALFVSNFALIRSGPQQERIRMAPMLVNRAGFAVRLGFHLLINWSALASILFWAFRLADPIRTPLVARASVVAVFAIWLAFNVMHRRFNRARNLILSSVPAACLLAAAFLLIRAY